MTVLDELPAVSACCCERGREVDLAVGCGCACFQEKAFYPGRAEEHHAVAGLLPDVGARVGRASGYVDGLSGGQAHSLPIDLHFEVARDDVDRLGLVVMSMGWQRPARRRLVNEQAERAASLFGCEVDLGANAARHPDDASIGCHAPTITTASRRCVWAREAKLTLTSSSVEGTPQQVVRAVAAPGVASKTPRSEIMRTPQAMFEVELPHDATS